MARNTQALAPYVTQCVGIDLSENMVAVYNDRARNQVSCWLRMDHRSFWRSPPFPLRPPPSSLLLIAFVGTMRAITTMRTMGGGTE